MGFIFLLSLIWATILNASIHDEVVGHSQNYRSMYKKIPQVGHYQSCHEVRQKKTCIVVVNFDPENIALKNGTNSSSDISEHFPRIIKTKFDVPVDNLFYIDLQLLRSLKKKYPKDSAEQILRNFKKELLGRSGCKQVNAFYSGHGEKEEGKWIAILPNENFDGMEIFREKLKVEKEIEEIEKKLEILDKEMTQKSEDLQSLEKKNEDARIEVIFRYKDETQDFELTFEEYRDFLSDVGVDIENIPSEYKVSKIPPDKKNKWLKEIAQVYTERKEKYKETKKTINKIKIDLSKINKEKSKLEDEKAEKVYGFESQLNKSYNYEHVDPLVLNTEKGFLFSDSCYSGAIHEGKCLSQNVISSAGAKEIALSSSKGGVFTSFQDFFISNQTKDKDEVCLADLNGDGEISYDEMNLYYAMFRSFLAGESNELNKKHSRTLKDFEEGNIFDNIQTFSSNGGQSCFLKTPSFCKIAKINRPGPQCSMNYQILEVMTKKIDYYTKNQKKIFAHYLDEQYFIQDRLREHPDIFKSKASSLLAKNVQDAYANYISRLVKGCETYPNKDCGVGLSEQQAEKLVKDLNAVLKSISKDQSENKNLNN